METNLVAELVGAVIACILMTVGEWKILSKMGEKGWKALIPVYSEYIIFKKVWNVKAFKLVMAFIVLAVITASVADVAAGSVLLLAGVLTIAFSVVVSVINVICLYKLSKAFGHGLIFTTGLVLMQPIFTFGLGVGKRQYTAA